MDVDGVYRPFEHKGLEVLWIFGEGNDGGPYPLGAVEAFVQNAGDKGVTFPVLRDHLFQEVFKVMEGQEDALPIQYILDARTMELRHISVGNADVAWDVLDELLED